MTKLTVQLVLDSKK